MNSRTLLIGLAVASFSMVQQITAQLTNEAWYHLGDVTDYYADSSTNNRRIGSAYSHVPWNNPAYGGNFSGIITPTGVGGPLGASGYTSSASLRAGKFGTMICTMWNAAGYAPPIKDYFIEISVQPHGKGYVYGSSGAWILSVNSSRGLGVRVWDDGAQSYYVGTILESPNVDVGNPVPIDTNSWTHLAMVNDNGTVTFYVNGVANGSNTGGAVSAPAGDLQFGRDNAGFDGLMDEARVCTFAAGTFTTNYFLLPPPGPQIVRQPQNASVWDGGATPFTVSPVINPALTYQWRRNDANVAGGNAATLYLPQVASAASGDTFACVLTANSLSITSATATLTVVPPNPADISAYRDAVMAESSLLAYFPVDDCLGTTVTNRKNAALNGVWAEGVSPMYDGRTNRAFAQRALMFDLDGYVQIPADGAYDFSSGNGTIEAVIYMSTVAPFDATVFAVGWDAQGTNYAVQASSDGSSIICVNDAAGRVSFPAPQSLIGRKAHLAVVYNNTTNITVYLDGQSLGTKQQASFGGMAGAPAWIGTIGTSAMNRWAGAIDELSLYGSALSENTVQTHYSRYLYGTNVAAPSIVSQPGAKTLLAGSAPILSVKAAGTLPITYQWKSNDIPIPGATSPLLTAVSSSGIASTAIYTLSVANAFGSTNSAPITLTFVPATEAYPQAILRDHPSSYWRLGESGGTLATDSAGFNDATYTGPLTLGQPGAIAGDPNTAVLFSNSGSAASAPYTPTLNPTTPFSVEFFAKPSQSGQIQRCLIGAQNRDVGRSGYAIYQGLNGNFWEVHMGDASTVQIWLFGRDPIVAGQWYHVVLVYNPADTNAAARIYVNGLDNTDYVESTLTGNFLANNSKPFDIGSRAALGVPYNGTIDEVAWYNYALTAEQIRSHMGAGVPLQVSVTKATGVVADTKPSGTPNNGLNNGAIWVASDSGRSGVMQFANTATTQVTVPTSAAFDSSTGTIMFWMRSAGAVGTGNEGAMLFDRRTTSGYVFVLADDGRLFLQTVPTAANTFNSATPLADNAWHHVTVTYDTQEGGTVAVYIDGNLNEFRANSSAWTWPAGQQIELGRSHDAWWKNYNGLLDDVRVYNRVLTDAEVTQAFGGNVVDAAALVGRYNFDAAPADGVRVGWSPSYGSLQWSTSVTGPFTDLTGASNPYLVAPSGPQLYFRGKMSQ